MKKEIKDLWVKALRSGEYSQGQGVLRQGNDYCCLGVLCDLAIKEGALKRTGVDAEDDVWYYGTKGMVELPPPTVVKWAGLPDSNPAVDIPDSDEIVVDRRVLAELNDEGNTFDEIADYIERSL